jgi:hypothetical protein
VEILNAAGQVLLARELPADAPCPALAEAAAVIVSSALREQPSVPSSEASAEPARAAPGRTEVAARGTGARHWAAEVGASLNIQLSGGSVAAGGAAEVSLWPQGSSLAGRLSLAGGSFISTAYAGGEVAWTRLPVGLGLRWRLQPARRVLLDLQPELLNALVVLEGRGYPGSRRGYSYDPGAALGVRLGLGLGSRQTWVPFVAAAMAGWFRSQELVVQSVAGRETLPRIEIVLRVGVALEISAR